MSQNMMVTSCMEQPGNNTVTLMVVVPKTSGMLMRNMPGVNEQHAEKQQMQEIVLYRSTMDFMDRHS